MNGPSCTLLPFPSAASVRLQSTVNLLHLDGRLFASAGFLPGDPGAAWGWIVETVAHEHGCHEDDVHTGESNDGDTVTVDGVPVYMVEIVRPLHLR
jgi:hypothetical protein